MGHGTARSHPASAGIRFEVLDVLSAPLPHGPFDVVVDRGVFHVFDAHDERARCAAAVAEALRPGGCWLTLAGSTEGPPRETGPPRRTALHAPLTGAQPKSPGTLPRGRSRACRRGGCPQWWQGLRRAERRAAGVASQLGLDSGPEVLMSINDAHILLYTPEPELLLDEPRHLIAIEAGGGSDGP